MMESICQVATWGADGTAIIEKYRQLHIAVGKFGASTAGISQPLDAHKMFSNVHHYVGKCHETDPTSSGMVASHENIQNIVDGQIEKRGSKKLKNQKRVIVSGFLLVLQAIRVHGTREMGTESFNIVGLKVHGNTIVCYPHVVLDKYKQLDYIRGDTAHKVMTYGN